MLVSLSYFWADYPHLGIILHNSALSIVAKKEVNVKNFFPNIDFLRRLTAKNLIITACFLLPALSYDCSREASDDYQNQNH